MVSPLAGIPTLAKDSFPWTWVGFGTFSSVMPIICMFLASQNNQPGTPIGILLFLSELALVAASITGRSQSMLFLITYVFNSVLFASAYMLDEPQENIAARVFAHTIILWGVISPDTRQRFLANIHGCIQASKHEIYKIANMLQRKVSGVHKHDDYDYAEMLAKFELDSTKSYFLLQAAIRMEWVHLSLISASCFILRLIIYCRKLLLIQMLGTFSSGETANMMNFWLLTCLWIMSYTADFALDYAQAKRKRLIENIVNVIRTKVMDLYLSKNCSYDEFNFSIEKCNRLVRGLAYYLTAISELALDTLTQMFGLVMIISTVGWFSALPIGLAAVITVLSVKTDAWLDGKRNAIRKKRKPVFQENATTMFKNMRTVKQYAWESKLLSTFKHGKEYPTLAWHERAWEFILQRIRLCTSEIIAVISLTLHMQNGGGITYLDLTQLLYKIGELVDFTRSLTYASRYMEAIHELDDELLKLLKCHKFNYISRKPASYSATCSINMNNCVFSWGKEKFQLQPLDLTVELGEFVTVVGKVGSGKSSLLSAICGEMPLNGGTGCAYGTIGYVSQKPWIMNATFRDNVLFGNDYDEKRYSQIIMACALSNDFKQLPAQDQTEIGSKGVNLSGGQKARLALARAIYNNADIYILDDILSAVDAQVERHLIEHVLAGNGILRGKTRILVTHADHVIPLSNRTFSLDEGSVTISKQDNIAFSEISSGKDKDFGSFETEKPKSTNKGAFKISPELDVPQFNKAMFWKFIALSGFTMVSIALLLAFLQARLTFSADSTQRAFFRDNNSYITLQSLQRYMLLDMLIKLANNQLVHLGYEFQGFVWGMQIMEKMRSGLANRLAYTPLSVFERLSTHTILDIYEDDLVTMPINLPIFMCMYVKQAFNSMYSLYGLIKLNPYIIIIMAPFVFLVHWFNKWHQTELEQHDLKVQAHPSKINDYIGELIDGNEVVRIHNKNDMFIRHLQNVCAQTTALKANSPVILNINYSINKVLYAFVELSTILYARWLSAHSTISPSPSDINAWMDMCSDGVRNVSSVLEGFVDYLKMLPMLAKYFVYAEQLAQEAPHETKGIQIPKNWPENGIIEFKDYSLRYHEDLDNVLNGVVFSTCKHEKVGIVGRTGAGKSSLTYALLRLIEPAGGSIRIDGIDTSTLGLYDLRSRISIVPQDPMLLEGTIRDNLDPAHEYTDAEIWDAVNKACVADMLLKLDENPTNNLTNPEKAIADYKTGTGLDTWVESDGKNYSVGLRQLISLCRALLWKRSILILDEATANIDSKTDEVIQSIIRTEFKHCTVLTIAHRLNTVMDSDRILVMDQGKVAEFDTPDNLLARESHFAQLVKSMQFNEKAL